MATNWTFPSLIEQYAEESAEETHISWSNLEVSKINSSNKISLTTFGDLYRIARSPKHDLISKTYYLKLTGFNFLNVPPTLSGIEMRLTGNRRGRVMDDTISLCLNGLAIGENRGKIDIMPITTYGSENDIWGSELTINNVNDVTFGVIMRFKSHIKWPHKDPMFIDCVELRIH
jgi:hypothetical protein